MTLYTKNLVLQHNLQTHIVMKNLTLLLFTILLLTFASCTQTNEDKARSLIEDQLKKTMNDWSSYEFVEMTPLDSSFSVLSDNEEYYNLGLKLKVLDAKSNYFISNVSSDYRNMDMWTDSAKQVIAEMESVNKRMDEIQSSFVPEHNGWWTNFTCRGNNKLGQKVISKTCYYFNKEITEITDTKKVE